MPKPRVVRLAESFRPNPSDPLGEDKKRLIKYLLDNQVGSSNPKPIAAVLKEVHFTRPCRREAFQHQILGPLRRDPRVFVGTSGAGIFLVTTPQDADTTLGFYTWRVRAELRHARNLRALARRAKLHVGHVSTIPDKKERAVIYVDESGSPNVQDLAPPVFVVAAVMIDSREDLSRIDQRFKNAFAVIERPELRRRPVLQANHLVLDLAKRHVMAFYRPSNRTGHEIG